MASMWVIRLAVEHHADEFTGPAPGVAPFRRVGVAALAAIHHEALHLVGNIGSHLGGDGPGAANGYAVGHQSHRSFALLGADKVEAAKLSSEPQRPQFFSESSHSSTCDSSGIALAISLLSYG